MNDNRWRTYEEVVRILHVSKERVRQLLKPSKLLLAEILGDNIPSKSVERKPGDFHSPRGKVRFGKL